MKNMPSVVVASLLVVFCSSVSRAAETVAWVSKPKLSVDAASKRWHVTFELDSLCDVEVAIVDPKSGDVMRHLAAGVLGAKAPPPLQANARAQKIEWDGKDDYGQPMRSASGMVVRVRAGMSVSLEQIVGGDPYAYYSDEMEDSDHSPWGINGLVAKPDGKVYVWGHSSNLGPPALRQYDVDGNYLQTLFPMPAGKDVNIMKGWGIHVKPDGTYTPKFSLLVDPSLTTTFLDTNLRMARLLASPGNDQLTFMRMGLKGGSFDRMTINSDGTIAAKPAEQMLGPLVKNPPFKIGSISPGNHVMHSMVGPVFVGFAPDGESYFLSGMYAATTIYGSIRELKLDSFWRDGRVWKVDVKTGNAKVFYSLDRDSIPTTPRERTLSYGGANSYAAIHGVTVDQDNNVFVCDRLNQRIVVLNPQGKLIRTIALEHPDAIAISKKTGKLYVTTRFGDYHKRGKVHLVKFNNWRKDDKPAEKIEVSKTGHTGRQRHSYVVVCDTDQGSNVWVAHAQMPVRSYRDGSEGLALLKDFFRVKDAQRCLGFDRMQVDPKTEEVYLTDAHDAVWKVSDWKQPRFIKVPVKIADLAIDARRRYLFGRTQYDGAASNSVGKIARFHLDQEDYPLANYGNIGTNRVTDKMQFEWCFEGNSDKGLAIAPNGNIAVVGGPKDGLRVFSGNETNVPWQGIKVADLPANAGGVRFDFAGNLYVGYVDKNSPAKLEGFKGDPHLSGIGRIHKYAPTGSLASGNLFPKPAIKPTHTYDVPYGAFQTQCVTRGPRFGLDGFGRIYYPTSIQQRVSIIDNAGNEILHFGTYGNRDSMGGLPGDRVPTKGIPLAFPNSVDATDNYVYVADMVNLRVLRLKNEFQAIATSQ